MIRYTRYQKVVTSGCLLWREGEKERRKEARKLELEFEAKVGNLSFIWPMAGHFCGSNPKSHPVYLFKCILDHMLQCTRVRGLNNKCDLFCVLHFAANIVGDKKATKHNKSTLFGLHFQSKVYYSMNANG